MRERIDFSVARCINPLEKDVCLWKEPEALVLINKHITIINGVEYVHVAKYMPKDEYIKSLNLGLRRKDRFEEVDYDLDSVSNQCLIQIIDNAYNTKLYSLVDERLKLIKDNFYYPEKDVKDMSFDELRKYVTVFSMKPFSSYIEPLIDLDMTYDDEKRVRNSLNEEFNKRIPERVLMFYNKLDSIHNTEKWGGEERYKLFSLACNLFMERNILSAALELNNLDFSKTENILVAMKYSRILPYVSVDFNNELRMCDIAYKEDYIKVNNKHAQDIEKYNEYIKKELLS